MESSEEGESDEMLAKMSEGTACKECSRSTSTKRRYGKERAFCQRTNEVGRETVEEPRGESKVVGLILGIELQSIGDKPSDLLLVPAMWVQGPDPKSFVSRTK